MKKRDIAAEIEARTVDCYDEYEQAAAWEVAFDDEVTLPFAATLLGISVTVTEFRLGKSEDMQCKIVGNGRERWVNVEGLDSEGLPDDMVSVLELYQAWQTGSY